MPNLLIINFTSNGLNGERLKIVAQELNHSFSGIIGINISIDGPEEIHQKLRGGTASYQKAIETLRMIRTFKRIRSHASMTIFNKNKSLIKATYEQIKVNIADFKKNDLQINYSFESDHFYKKHSRF